MYTIHRTRGLVLSSMGSGEADRTFVIFTEQLGRIEATAKSVREERSRLRYALTPYTLGEYAFIRGRHGWRVVGARDERNYGAHITGDAVKKSAFERMMFLVGRLVRGEGKNEGLFAVICNGADMLTAQHDHTHIEALEVLVVLRVLFVLGYISTEKEGISLQPFVATSHIDTEVLEKVHATKRLVIRSINDALAASHL